VILRRARAHSLASRCVAARSDHPRGTQHAREWVSGHAPVARSPRQFIRVTGRDVSRARLLNAHSRQTMGLAGVPVSARTIAETTNERKKPPCAPRWHEIRELRRARSRGSIPIPFQQSLSALPAGGSSSPKRLESKLKKRGKEKEKVLEERRRTSGRGGRAGIPHT
jgi:hypothetical protein